MTNPSGQRAALWASTFAFTICFAVWTIFSIIGIQIKKDLGLTDTQFGLLVGTPILTGSLIRLMLGIWADQYGGRLVYVGVMIAAAMKSMDPALEESARVMGASKVNFFYDQLLVKEPGTRERTPWHHDQPYYPIDGEQIVSLWLPLDPVDRATCVEYVKGSHRWGRWFQPKYFRQGGVVGIGAQIDIYRGRLWGSELIAAIILASAFGLVVFIVFGFISKKAIGKWHTTTRGQ